LSDELYQKIITENSFEKMTEKKTGLVGIRVDINYKRVVKSPRMDVCAESIVKVSKMGYVPIIFAHQGRMTDEGPDENCISLKSHADMLDSMLHNINVHFQNDPILSLSEYDFVGLQPGKDAIVLENTRMELNDEVGNMEKDVAKGRQVFNKLFDEILDYYIVDAFPTSHRASTTMSPTFDTTPVLFGENTKSIIFSSAHHVWFWWCKI